MEPLHGIATAFSTSVRRVHQSRRGRTSQGHLSLTLLEQLVKMDPSLIVEHNGRYVYRKDYDTVRVSATDRVELIHPDFGG